VFWVISVYFNIRNTLPNSGAFLLGHPVYFIWVYVCVYVCTLVCLRTYMCGRLSGKSYASKDGRFYFDLNMVIGPGWVLAK